MAASGELDKEELIREVTRSLGYKDLKKEQKDAIMYFISSRDVFVALPTGFGKSLIYGCLPHLFDRLKKLDEPSSIVIVVSPLKALMKDQADKFKSLGINAAYVGDKSVHMESFISGQIKLIFISPESLNRGSLWRSIIKSDTYQELVVGLVVDEAHLVKNWDENYRPDFSRLGELRSLLPKQVNILALTATATQTLQNHVISVLGMIDPIVIETSLANDNLYFSISEFTDASFEPIMQELKEKRVSMDRTLIFCRRPLDCANLWIRFHGYLGENITEPPGSLMNIPELRLVDYFTGCTEEGIRDIILKQFSTPSCLRIVIATVAFGLGVNCPDVRRVIHYGIPEDIETYVQQVGRAGRDGQISYCTMLYGKGVYTRYCNSEIIAYCRNKDCCRRKFLYSKFRSYSPNNSLINTCMCCDICSINCCCYKCNK